MNRRISAFLFFISLTMCAVPAAFANLLGNVGFEEEIGNGSGNNWDNTNGAARVTTGTLPGGGFSAVPEGNFALDLANATDFTFQVFDGVKPGDFVSFSALAESSVVIGGGAQGGQVRIEFQKKNEAGDDALISALNSAFITTTNAPAGGGYIRFTVTGSAPPDTNRIVFVLRGQGGAAGNVVFDSVNGEVNPLEFAASASKTHVKAGDVVTIFSEYTNASAAALTGVELFANISSGLALIPDSVRVNNEFRRFREGSFIIPVGTVLAGQKMTATFQVLVTSAVTAGKQYDIELFLNNGTNLSERLRIRLIVKSDPVFDEGTLIGKVFNDANQNGVQDKEEKGIPWVRLATEEGIVITTDENGKYHIRGLAPGRHVVKIDGHSLPEGTKFITEESYLFKTTPGIMNKVNFAVLMPPSSIPEEFQKDLTVAITQGLDTSRPVLDVSMEPEVLKAGLGILEKEPVFKLGINYEDFLKAWYLEIRDELGREVWTGFGVGIPPAEVVWSGQTEEGLLVKPGIYSYQFKVEDKGGRQDWTTLHFFRVVAKSDAGQSANEGVEIPPIGDFNIFKDGKRSIPLVGKPTIRIQGRTLPNNQVTVNDRPVSVDPESGLFQTEFYTSPGEKEVVVRATNPEGESTAHRQTVKVRDSTFFMVALGEEQLGRNWASGDVGTTGDDDRFKQGFYEDGRLSYYLRGKLKGKFLVKSHYDTGDTRSALFTNLDPDDYYPIYGDASTRDYEARDSKERFYLVMEMDRSFIKWGSFKTEFEDTELATYNRTLSGLKVNIDSLKSTPYGDSARGVKVFWNKTNQRADHVEFAATGGSLYYLRNRRVIEGSEKLRVETRDKIQDMSVGSYDLQEGKDYEIDYEEGRILLSRPLSSVAASDTLVSADLMDGNPVFLIVDYEFEADPGLLEHENRGIRGYTHIGDHLKIGGTAVEEKRGPIDYDLRGVDATLKVGRNTRFIAEYAESTNQQLTQSVSYNGGLSFADLGPIGGRKPRQSAALVKMETKPVKNFDVTGFVQDVEPGFSSDRIRSQEGFKKYGVAARYKIHEVINLRYRFDSSELVTQLRPPFEKGVSTPFETVKSHTVQADYDDGKWLGVIEYKRQNTQLPERLGNELIDSFYSEFPFDNAVAAKLGYHLNDRLLPYVKVQTFMEGDSNHQFGGGFRYEVAKDMFAHMEQMIGNFGDSTYFGFEQFHGGGASRSYMNLRMFDRGIGTKTLKTAIGNSFALTEKSRVYSEREHSTYTAEDGYADILGYEGRAGDHWDFDAKFERRHFDSSRSNFLDDEAGASLIRTNTFNTVSGAVGYADGSKLRARTSLEFRLDQDAPKISQWVTRNSLEYKLTPDLSFLGKLDFGWSHFEDPEDMPANFAELSTGFAYRPIEHDRFNALTRYTYLKDIANDIQFSTPLFTGLETDETAHIVALDMAYDLHRYLGLVDKIAFKRGIFGTAVSRTVVNSYLFAHRFNFHVTRKWDLALEYRTLIQTEAADSFRHGPLVEIDREFYDYVRLGLGYNFTDFEDDLRSSQDFDSHGPFVRLSGKF